VGDIMKKGRILPGGSLDQDAKSILRQSSGKTVTMIVNYKDPANTVKKGSVSFEVR
jgi:hypothetical protein